MIQLTELTNLSLPPAISPIAKDIANLQIALQQNDPDIINYVRHIRNNMLADATQVTMLTNQERAIFFTALSSITKEQIIAREATKKSTKAATSTKLKNLSMDDFI